MKREHVKVVRSIEEIAKTSDLNEYEILEELNAYFEKKKRKTIVKLYTKERKKRIRVMDICARFKISSKTFYKILDDYEVEANRKFFNFVKNEEGEKS